jgi:hypothetical protein
MGSADDEHHAAQPLGKAVHRGHHDSVVSIIVIGRISRKTGWVGYRTAARAMANTVSAPPEFQPF